MLGQSSAAEDAPTGVGQPPSWIGKKDVAFHWNPVP